MTVCMRIPGSLPTTKQAELSYPTNRFILWRNDPRHPKLVPHRYSKNSAVRADTDQEKTASWTDASTLREPFSRDTVDSQALSPCHRSGFQGERAEVVGVVCRGSIENKSNTCRAGPGKRGSKCDWEGLIFPMERPEMGSPFRVGHFEARCQMLCYLGTHPWMWVALCCWKQFRKEHR